MHPYADVIRVDGNTVVHAEHDGEVPQFHGYSISQQESEATDACVVADAFQRNIHRDGVVLAFNLQAFLLRAEVIHVISFDSADDTDV